MPNTKEIARKLLEGGVLTHRGYSLQDLFKIRDALYILDKYDLADTDLLKEVEKYIKQKAEV